MAIRSPVIDFHSHILSRVDHGCASTEESIRQLSLMRSFGTDIAVATSHFYPHISTANDFTRKVERALLRLRDYEITSSPKLCIGAEVLLCENLCSMSDLGSLCIRGTRVILLELPLHQLRENHYDTVEELISMGYTVVLAHIDRYLKRYPESVKNMLDIGALAQINADSLGHIGIRRTILDLLAKTDRICAVGSDLHGVDDKLYKKFATADKHLRDHLQTVMARSARLLEGAQTIEF
ncbi:MAG: hypothetical protein IJY08_04470 [Clostridia bacterium]|nr:hypothetical protein [Clostridia bacterium]